MKTKNGQSSDTVEAFYDLIDQQWNCKETRKILKHSKRQEKFRLMCYGASLIAEAAFIFWSTNNPLHFNHTGLEDQIDVAGTLLFIFMGALVIAGACFWIASYNHEFIDNLREALPRQKMVKDFRSALQYRNFNLSTPELIAEHIDAEARSRAKEIRKYEEYRRKNHSTSPTKAEKKARRYLKVLVSLASSLELMGTRYASTSNGLASSLKPLENRRAEWLYKWLFSNPDFTV